MLLIWCFNYIITLEKSIKLIFDTKMTPKFCVDKIFNRVCRNFLKIDESRDMLNF